MYKKLRQDWGGGGGGGGEPFMSSYFYKAWYFYSNIFMSHIISQTIILYIRISARHQKVKRWGLQLDILSKNEIWLLHVLAVCVHSHLRL